MTFPLKYISCRLPVVYLSSSAQVSHSGWIAHETNVQGYIAETLLQYLNRIILPSTSSPPSPLRLVPSSKSDGGPSGTVVVDAEAD